MSVITQTQITQYLNAQQTADQITSQSDSEDMGKEDFLKLLVAQMQYQDPLNPMEGVDFTAQLAQFSNLEQLVNLNSSFSTVSQAVEAQNQLQTINLVGKHVKAIGDTITVNDGSASAGLFYIDEAAVSTQVSIYNESGDLIRTINLGALEAGEHSIEWDGQDTLGKTVADGLYTFEIEAIDADEQYLSITSEIKGQVTGVTFAQDGTPILIIDDLKISLPQVIEITEA